MAGIEYDQFHADDGPGRGQTLHAIVNWAGALTSVALVAGLTVWGYRLMVRDVSGVPVVRALEGPARVVPEDPGGRQTAHQGLAVNRVTADGTAAPPAEKLLLAPAPVDLAAEDAARNALKPGRPEVTTASAERTVDSASGSGDEIAAPEAVVTALAKVEAVAGDGEQDVAPALTEATDTAADDTATDNTADAPEIVPASVAGLVQSPLPAPRPEGDLAAEAALNAITAAAEATPPKPQEIAAAQVAPGANLVQLGAFDSAEVARAEWQRLSARFDSFMEGKQRVVQSTESGGRTFYRLRAAGFSDIADARRFCAALTAERADCIPVVAR